MAYKDILKNTYNPKNESHSLIVSHRYTELRKTNQRLALTDFKIQAFGAMSMAAYTFRFLPILPMRTIALSCLSISFYTLGQRFFIHQEFVKAKENFIPVYRWVMENKPMEKLLDPELMEATRILARSEGLKTIKNWNESELSSSPSFWSNQPKLPKEQVEELNRLEGVKPSPYDFRFIDNDTIKQSKTALIKASKQILAELKLWGLEPPKWLEKGIDEADNNPPKP